MKDWDITYVYIIKNRIFEDWDITYKGASAKKNPRAILKKIVPLEKNHPSDKISKLRWNFFIRMGPLSQAGQRFKLKKNKGLHKGKFEKKIVRRIGPILNNLTEFNDSIRIFSGKWV